MPKLSMDYVMRLLWIVVILGLVGCQQQSMLRTEHPRAKPAQARKMPHTRSAATASRRPWRVAVPTEKDGAPPGPLPVKFKEVSPPQ